MFYNHTLAPIACCDKFRSCVFIWFTIRVITFLDNYCTICSSFIYYILFCNILCFILNTVQRALVFLTHYREKESDIDKK